MNKTPLKIAFFVFVAASLLLSAPSAKASGFEAGIDAVLYSSSTALKRAWSYLWNFDNVYTREVKSVASPSVALRNDTGENTKPVSLPPPPEKSASAPSAVAAGNTRTAPVVITGLSREELDTKLEQLNNKLSAEIYKLSASSGGGTTVLYQGGYTLPTVLSSLQDQISDTNKIDNLGGVDITGSTWSGGTIDGTAVTNSTWNGTTGSFSSTLSSGNLTVNGNLTVTATTTFNGVSYKFPSADGSSGQVLSTNGAGQLSWINGSQWTTLGSNIYYNTGNVGIGTTSPYAKLSVVGSSGVVAAKFHATSTTATSTFSGGLTTGSSGLNVLTNGKVGIGVAGPAAPLDVRAATGLVRIQSTTATAINYIQFQNTVGSIVGTERSTGGGLFTGSTGYATVLGSQGAYPVQFASNNSVNMTIASGGNVGIGTTTPTSLLQVAGATAPKITLSDTDASSNNKHWFIESDTGKFAIGTTSDALATNSSYRALTISAGKVGIGTSSPGYNLDISSTNNALTYQIRMGRYGIVAQTNGGLATLVGNNVKASAIDSTMQSLYTSGDGGQAIKLQYDQGITFHTKSGSVTAGNTYSSERVRIDRTGNVGIGSTSPYAKLSIMGLSGNTTPLFSVSTSTASATSTAFHITAAGRVGIGTTSPSYLFHVDNRGDGNVAGFTDANGTCTINPTSTALVCSSDERLKKDIVSLSSEDSLAKLLLLNPVSFRWNNQKDDTKRYGLIAQEVEKVFPEFVLTQPDGYKAVSYTSFIPMIVDGLKAVASEMQRIIAKVSGLESKMNALEERIKTLEEKNGIIPSVETLDSSSGESAAPSSTASTTPPAISIQGDNPSRIEIGASYLDLGAIAKDQEGRDLSVKTYLDGQEVSNVSIDTSALKTYTITYEATDGNGLSSSAERTVEVY